MEIEIAVIGGGVAGLASAVSLAERGASVCLLERERQVGHGTSTRNSGVIHAGFYYPTGSLKARLCVEGRDRLYALCPAQDIPHSRCGKLVVAADATEVSEIERLHTLAIANGVNTQIVDSDFITAREPQVSGAVAALWSPDSGIVQSEAYVRTLARLCAAREVAVLVGSPLVGAAPNGTAIDLVTPHETITARTVVNAAGLYADHVSRMLGAAEFTIYPCRGEYAELAPRRRSWVNGLIYPVPHGVGLGVHLVRTTWGSVLLGPTTCYQDARDDYESNRLPIEEFVEPARKLLPDLALSDLQPGGTGIRAKLHGPDRTFADFMIERDVRNPAVIQVSGIDSPGLTSSLAIGERVAAIWASDSV